MPGEVNEWDEDDPTCAHCGESVDVKADCEFNEGDLCNECLYVEYPKMKLRAESAERDNRRARELLTDVIGWLDSGCDLAMLETEIREFLAAKGGEE